MKFLIVSGLSGAGKSTATSILEDNGFFCMDNLPPLLLPKFAEMCQGRGANYDKVAMVCDVRGGTDFAPLFSALEELAAMGIDYQILFFEADNDTLIKRYKETRRAHPLMESCPGLVDAVNKERELMHPVRERSHHIISTTNLSTRVLRDSLLDLCQTDRHKERELNVSVCSFGFKYGVPLEADLVFDVRFLPNPFYVPELRPQTGLDAPVRDYVFDCPTTVEFMDRLGGMISFLLPLFVEEGKSSLVIAVGCTGGHHRSVAIAHTLSGYIRDLGYDVGETHRDISRM